MSNKSNQTNRGAWFKNRSDRGVFRRGKIWYVRYVDQHRKLHVERVGPSKAVANKVYQKRKTEAREGRFFPTTRVTFDEVIEDAITRSRERFELKYPEKTFKPGNYKIVGRWFKGRQASSITPQEIAEKLSQHCVKPATHNRFRVALSHAYKIAIENKKILENPARLVMLQRENNERVRWLNEQRPDEERALRAAIRNRFPEREPELDLALHTGMRWGEQYQLIWKNVDIDRGLITILQAKSGRKEHVRINSEAAEALTKLKSIAPKSDLVCPFNKYDQHREWWLSALRAAKIKDFRWHDLRHTFASRLVMNGVDIFTVNRLLRHASIQMTMRYAHLADNHLKVAIEKLVPTRSDTESDTAIPGSKAAVAYVH